MNWTEVLRRWDQWMSLRDMSPTTREQYRYWLLKFAARTMIDPLAATQDDWIDYLSSLPEKGVSRDMALRASRSFYGFAEDRELCVSPVRQFTPKKDEPGPAPTLDVDEGEVLRIALAAWSYNPRDAWIILLLYATGGRAGSICDVHREDIREDRVWFRTAKAGRRYGVPLGHVGREAVHELLKFGYPTLIGIKYGRLHQVVARAGRDAGIHAWPHLFRHVFGTEVARRTDPRHWQELMGHADLSQYKRYVAVQDEGLRKAVEDL